MSTEVGASAGAGPGAARATLGDLISSGAGPLATVISTHLDPHDRVALAATSSAYMRRVMESLDGAGACRWCSEDTVTGRSVAEKLHAHAGTPATRSLVGWNATGYGEWLVYCAAGADPSLEESVVRVAASPYTTANRPDSCPPITEGMTGLREVSVRGVDADWIDSEDWLPAGVRATLRVFDAHNSSIRQVPAGLNALQELTVSECAQLDAEDWLPESSRRALRVIDAWGTGILRVPPGLQALEVLDVSICWQLDVAGEDWLPETSRGALQTLRAESVAFQRLPEGTVLRALDYWVIDNTTRTGGPRCVVPPLPLLEELSLELTDDLWDNFVAAIDFGRLRKLCITLSVYHGSLASDDPGQIPVALPEMRALEELELTNCVFPNEETWLPESSRGRLRVLHLEGGNVRRVPPGLGALRTLTMSGGLNTDQILEDNWLPASSRAKVAHLTLEGFDLHESCVHGMPALRKLVLLTCRVAGHILDARTWQALTHLELIACHVQCQLVPPSPAPRGAVALRSLTVTSLVKPTEHQIFETGELRALDLLDVSYNPRCVDLEHQVAAFSGSCVRRLQAQESSMRYMPRLEGLQEIDVTRCTDLGSDWLDALLPSDSVVRVHGPEEGLVRWVRNGTVLHTMRRRPQGEWPR
ncbi:unnamed protein product [Pedinophyceae sp. YPF-701]|nr:unnamed protein product [Pedinophyceae sp. YPF-701]